MHILSDLKGIPRIDAWLKFYILSGEKSGWNEAELMTIWFGDLFGEGMKEDVGIND